MASFWPLLFLLLALSLNGIVAGTKESTALYGGPALSGASAPVLGIEGESGALLGPLTSDSYQVAPPEGFVVFNDASVYGLSSPSSDLAPARNGLTRYRVRKGDTLTSISSQFGISLETIKWANPNLRPQPKAGQELVIFPVSGVLYEVKSGDSLESVVSLYQVSQEFIKQYNPDYQKIFSDGKGLVILPYAKPAEKTPPANRNAESLPDLRNYFALPAVGWNWGELHDENAVDIANQCGTAGLCRR